MASIGLDVPLLGEQCDNAGKAMFKLGERPWFVNADRLRQVFACSLCHKIALEPQQTNCGSRVCKKCIDKCFGEKEKIACPVFHHHLTYEELQQEFCQGDQGLTRCDVLPDCYAQRSLSREMCYCFNRYLGCQHITMFQHLEKHEECCPFSATKVQEEEIVEDRCNEPEPVKDPSAVTYHCQLCEQNLSEEQMLDHETQCPNGQRACKMCGRIFERPKEVLIHQRVNPDCIIAGGKCYYYQYCCTETTTAEELRQHMIDSTEIHMSALTEHVEEAKQCNEDKKEDVSSVKEDLMRKVKPLQKLGAECALKAQKLLEKMLSDPECSGQLEALIQRMTQFSCEVKHLEEITERNYQIIRSSGIDQDTAIQSCKGAMLSNALRTSTLEETVGRLERGSFNGKFVWRIPNYSNKKQFCMNDEDLQFYSPCFYTHRYGYKFSLMAQLNGLGLGRGTHLSLYIGLLQGQYDNILSFPMRKQIVIGVYCPANPLLQCSLIFEPDDPQHEEAFLKPEAGRQNRGIGSANILSHEELETNYLVDDTLFVWASIKSEENQTA